MSYVYDWQRDIVPRLNDLQPVPGGFTKTRRGMLNMPDGAKLFIKIAVDDENTKKWVRKEVDVYTVLGQQNYAYAPKMLASNDDKTGFATEFLDQHQFDRPWDEEMLGEVMNARQALEQLKPHFDNDETYSLHSVVSMHSRWGNLADDELIQRVNHVLEQAGVDTAIDRQSVDAFASEMSDWKPNEDTLVHQDIRADNFGYDPTGKAGKLVDWNWLCIGDKLLDVTPMFVSVRKISGLDPYEHYPELYSRTSLLYIIGYWLEAISGCKVGEDLSPVRIHQAESAAVALAMLRQE